MPNILPTPRSSSSGDLSASELRSSSMEAEVSTGIASGQFQEGPLMQHLRRLILSVKHEERSGEELELFLNTEADHLEAFFEVVSLRSIVRGFVLLGSEIGDLSGKLKEAEVHLEHQVLKLASTEKQVQKISRQ